MNSWPIILIAWAVGVVHGWLLKRWWARRQVRQAVEAHVANRYFGENGL
jgi:hypothetical protein